MSVAGEPRLVSALPLDPFDLIPEREETTGRSNLRRRYTSHDIHGSENSQQEPEEEEIKDWDVFGLSSDEWQSYRAGEFKVLLKLLKIAVYLITFCLVLGSAVVSKASLLFMTSAINPEGRFRACGELLKDTDRTQNIILIKDRNSWIWCLLFALFVPEVLTLIHSVRFCIFKKYTIPHKSTFFLVLAAESLHVIGLVMMLFVAFPKMHFLKTLTLTNAVCILPSALNFLSNWNTDCNRKSVSKTVFDLLTFLSQVTAIFVYIVFASQDHQSFELWISAISLLLISCAWWENFVNVNSKIFYRLENVKKNIEESRQFMYIFISLWKICLTLASCVAYLYIMENDVKSFFTHLKFSFPELGVSIDSPLNYELNPTSSTDGREIPFPKSSWNRFYPVIIATIHVVSSYLCYICGKFACKICIQGFSYALPILLTVPTTACLLYLSCAARLASDCKHSSHLLKILPYLFLNCPGSDESLKVLFINKVGFIWILWILSQCWLTLYTWTSKKKRMASTDELFVNPMYCTAFIDQSMALNRRKDQEINELLETIPQEAYEIAREKSIPRILACATMWHETPDEMELLLKSIMRMDNDQCLKRAFRNQLKGADNNDYYEVEAHIFFDDAFVISDEDDSKMVINSFVKDLVASVDIAASKIYPPEIKLDPPIKVPTPYGGRLIWKLQGDNIMVAHLKNKDLIRHKKRWSQVMYMYYLLGYRLMNPDLPGLQRDDLAKNTYILALDGDIDFKPDAVQLLVDLMKRNENLGAACGRIHPVGTGMMVYYQKFEYAIGHWLQKATEHMIGCVLCSPGCFSLFRAEALMQENVIRRYATESKEAIEFVQFDQGEDRWLCTLLLQSGSRVEYSAASDAYTHCPESFAEFYTQRRRWAPSTMANIMDLLINYKKTVKCNDNISLPYIGYQLMLMVGTVLGPGTIFLMLVGAMVTALGISNWQALIANFIPIAFFILMCFVAKNDTQILIAQIFSAAYALLMMAVVVAIALQIVMDGIASPAAIFLLSLTASFIIAAILHPREFLCVIHGMIYFLSVPSMYLLLTLYSIINLHVVSWGTREVATKIKPEQLQAAKDQKKSGIFDWFSFLNDKRNDGDEEEGGISFGLANLFRCMCFTYPKPDTSKVHLIKIGEQLESLNKQISNLQRQIDTSVSRTSGFRRRSSLHGLTRDPNLIPVAEDEEDEEEIQQDDVDGDTDEHMYNQIAISNQINDEFWLSDTVLKKSPTYRMLEREETFWKELIERYLKPLNNNPEEKAKAAAQLLELRNKVVFGILMLNSLFILIVFLLQKQKSTLYIEWPFGKEVISIIYSTSPHVVLIEFRHLQLEPINLILVFFFSLIVVIQFIAMLFHRFQTISHILASTELSFTEESTKPEVMMAQLADILQNLNLRPDDTVDGDTRRRSTICWLDHKRQERPQVRSLSVAYEQTLKGLVENDFQTVHKVRRLSKNPALLGAVRRLSVCPSPNTTPGSTMRRNNMLRDIQRLDEAFSSSIRSSHINRGYEDSLDGGSVTSSMTRSRLSVPQMKGHERGSSRSLSGSARSLKNKKESDKC